MSGELAIIGASGLLGSALSERLHFEGGTKFRPFLHSTASGWRLARLPLRLETLDVTDRRQTEAALAGCSVVVNCSRGGRAVMLGGLQNLINAAKKNRLQKFIHISSMAIYGLTPPTAAATEAATPDPGYSEYAQIKLRQDEMVMRLNRSGLASYILCPPNISGPYSIFSRGLAAALAQGSVAVVDEGKTPANVVHVDNLAEAILTVARSDRGAGERYFVNETRPVSWKSYFQDLLALMGKNCEFIPVTREEVLAAASVAQLPFGLKEHFRIALSGEFRRALGMMPAFSAINELAARCFTSLPTGAQQWMRARFERPVLIRPRSHGPSVRDLWVRAQVDEVFHSPAKLVRLGYEPVLTYEKGLEMTSQWLHFVRAV